jgi:nucleoredoxin
VEKYKEILAAGKNFEIIFVSGDEDEDGALRYFSEMPWKMLSYAERDTEAALSKKYEVRGIPSLIIIDENGELITSEGREAIMSVPFDKLRSFEEEKKSAALKEAMELEMLKSSFKPIEYFSSCLVGQDNAPVDASETLFGKIIGLYFSAHWCPPCRGFTPRLSEKYEELIKGGKNFEIIFVSSDRDEATAAEYFKEMPWKMLAFSQRDKKKTLSSLYDVSGIPTLILIDSEGGIITSEGREAIMTVPFDKIKDFENEKKAAAEKLEQEIKEFPDQVTLKSHEHPLAKILCPYRGGAYGCDVCGGGGKGWVFHCEKCNFDACPRCAMKAD